jgi:predicted Zn-dependent protease
MAEDAEDAVRIVSGMLRRGEGGEAFRERRRATSWSAGEAGLLLPSTVEERGTAVRVRRGGESLLVARPGDGPEALREAVREASRRAGGSPFFKRRPTSRWQAPPPSVSEEEAWTAVLAAALARAIPDPRGLSLSLVVSRVAVTRAVITSRDLVLCGTSTRLEATGLIGREKARRTFSFQASGPWPAAVSALETALREATRPAPSLRPESGETDVILSPSAAAVFFHEAVGHPLEAERAERASVLARVPRAAVAPAGLHVVDEPARADLPGRYVHDDEGMSGLRVPLVEDGRVVGLLTDRRTAGADSNGHGRCSDYRRPPRPRLSNLVVSLGQTSFEELLGLCGNGLHVREVSGGSADPESGRFVLMVESADTIRRGRLGAAVSRFALSGDILAALNGLEADRGDSAPPATGLGICLKGGEGLAVGGAAPAVVVRGLAVRAVGA